jgi:outer membrane protein assembly factor BamB
MLTLSPLGRRLCSALFSAEKAVKAQSARCCRYRLSIVAALVTACSSRDKLVIPRWNQFHGDPANSGQTFAGTVPATSAGLISGDIGQLNFTSPVLAPDGSVVYSVSGQGATSGVFRATTNGSVVLVKHASLASEQLSTPAVDADGFIYTARFVNDASGSDIVIHPSLLIPGFEFHLNGKAIAPPKILDVVGGRLIFVYYRGRAPVGGHLLVMNSQRKMLLDQLTCSHIEGGSDFGFHVPGIELPAPFAEDPAVAIGSVQTDRGTQHFVVVASNRCGITFFRLDLAATQTEAPTLTTIKVRDIDAFFMTPAIALDGTVVINDSNKRTTAYEAATGNEKWHVDSDTFLGSTPTLPPLGISSVYIESYGELTKLDLATGAVQAKVPLNGPSDASPAIGGQHIFVSTTAGLSTFDLNLVPIAFTPLPGGRSSPAINTETGQVCVAGTDGKLYVFKGP